MKQPIPVFFILCLFLVQGYSTIQAQDHSYCGTPEEIANSLLEWRKQRYSLLQKRVSDTSYINLKIHLVGNDEGEGYYPLDDLLESFCKLNQDMIQGKIQYIMDTDFNYVANSDYNDHGSLQGGFMMDRYNVNGFANCYIVTNPNNNCGYYSPTHDAVALRKNCLGRNNTTWSHEMGHFFSLPHTFFGWEGRDYEYKTYPPRTVNRGILVENFDGSNCEEAADGFCDTKADYLSFRWNCVRFRSPDSLMDRDSTCFLVEDRNIMSYANDACLIHFTDEQNSAMQFNIDNTRSSLVYQGEIPETIQFDPDSFRVVEGLDGTTIPYDNAELKWRSVENASHYLLEVTLVKPFPTQPDYRIIVPDTTFIADFFEEGRRYDWRVKPFNIMDGCAEFSAEYQVTAGEGSSATTSTEVNDFIIYPNPMSEGENMYISVRNSSLINDGTVSVLSIEGKKLVEEKVNLLSGENTIRLSTELLQTGIYFVQLTDGAQSVIRKIVVH